MNNKILENTEKMPSKKDLVAATLPARILKFQGEESYKFLRALYKWFNGEKKATSQWIQIIDDIPLINPSG